MDVRFCDEQEWGIGWIAAEPVFMQRCSHALVVDGKVWLIDAVAGDGVEERVRALGEPAGVVQLLDRHRRDCAALVVPPARACVGRLGNTANAELWGSAGRERPRQLSKCGLLAHPPTPGASLVP